MPSKGKNVHLIVPEWISERVKQEKDFLNIRSKVITDDGREIRSVAEFIRWQVALYIEACEAGDPPDDDYDQDGDRGTISYTILPQTHGPWLYAVNTAHYADSIHELAGRALHRYFKRIDERADKDKKLLRYLQGQSATKVLGMLRRGEFNV